MLYIILKDHIFFINQINKKIYLNELLDFKNKIYIVFLLILTYIFIFITKDEISDDKSGLKISEEFKIQDTLFEIKDIFTREKEYFSK
jgi:hypothetical protein